MGDGSASQRLTEPRRRVERRDRPTVAEFLLDQLVEAGVDTVFGIPGDFILRLCLAIEQDPRVHFRTMSHEPGVGFAASGAARGSRGLGVACVTYGAGALNMVNPVAAAWAEKTPLLVVTGGPGADERRQGVLLHHQVKSFDSQRAIYREITLSQAVVDDVETAADEIRRAIDLCRAYSLPVYLQVPRDMVDRRIPVDRPRRVVVEEDAGAVEESAAEIMDRVRRARQPVLVVGVEVHRFRLTAQMVALAERLGVPVVTTFMARGAFPDDHPRYFGTYLGPASPPGVRELVEESDAVVMLGALLADTNMGVRLARLDPRRLMLAVSRTVRIGHHHYRDVPLSALIESMVAGAEEAATPPSRHSPERQRFARAAEEAATGALSVASLIGEINRSFEREGEMPLVVDTGDCLFCSHEIDTQLVLASAYYATMGFGVPAALGFAATEGDRPLVLVGDGGFQMTGWELLHAASWGVAPIVVVMNNRSWEMLDSFLPAAYNRIRDGRFAAVAAAWEIPSRRVDTAAALRPALAEARRASEPWLIEAMLEPGDISSTLRSFTRSVGTTPAPES